MINQNQCLNRSVKITVCDFKQSVKWLWKISLGNFENGNARFNPVSKAEKFSILFFNEFLFSLLFNFNGLTSFLTFLEVLTIILSTLLESPIDLSSLVSLLYPSLSTKIFQIRQSRSSPKNWLTHVPFGLKWFDLRL